MTTLPFSNTSRSLAGRSYGEWSLIQQQQSSSMTECILLDEKSACGTLYNGYPVVKAAFSSQSVFDKFINHNASSIASSLVTKYGCTQGTLLTDAVNAHRYQQSYLCSIATDDAITKGCVFDKKRFPAVGPVLCESECLASVSSTESIFSNNAACPGEKNAAERAGKIKTMKTYCTKASDAASKQKGLCVKGIPAEARGCGFSTLDNAKQGCTSMSSDPCCKDLLSLSTTSPALPPSTTKSEGGIPIDATVSIAIGSAILLMLVIAFAIFMRKRQAKVAVIKDTYREFAGSQDRLNDTATSPSQGGGHITSHVTLNTPPRMEQRVDDIHISPPTSFPTAPPLPAEDSPLLLGPFKLPDSHEFKVLNVFHPYFPTLEDELRLDIGDKVALLQSFDDDWAHGQCVKNGLQGAFPLAVCEAGKDLRQSVYHDERRQSDAHTEKSHHYNRRVSSQVAARNATPVGASTSASQYYEGIYS